MRKERASSFAKKHHVNRCFVSGYILDDYPCMNEEYMTVKEQMDLIKNMRIKPDFIINLKVH